MTTYTVITNQPIEKKIAIYGQWGTPTGKFKTITHPAGIAFKAPSDNQELAEKYADKLRRFHKYDVSVVTNYAGKTIY